MFEANKIEFAEFLEEIEPQEASELLQKWALANLEHDIMFQGKNRGFVCTIVTISKVLPELIICGPKPSTSIFKIANTKFSLGPLFCNDARRDASEARLFYKKTRSYFVPVPYKV